MPSKDLHRWIRQEATLSELMDQYPQLWRLVGPELVAAMETGRAETLRDYSEKAKAEQRNWELRIGKSRNNAKVVESAIPHLVRSRMALLALDRCYQSAALGRDSGKVRFNRWNGSIIQRLLFSEGLRRKPASLRSFAFWWRFVSQKRLLMPLVQPKGIYCFYSRELISELRTLIGERSCLELGAGDGTLSRFLAEAGVAVRATDDYSWTHTITYPKEVERLGARQALEKYEPQTVICSWPPPGNAFETRVFSSRSVELYIVVGSRFRFASGNWDAYESQSRFEWEIDSRLSSLVLPPELESAVLVFRRKTSSDRQSDHSASPR